MLEKAFKNKGAAESLRSRDGSFYESAQQMYERVPDLGDYKELWLCLQLFAAVRSQYMMSGGGHLSDHSSHAIKLVAKDLVKLFNSNPRWRPQEMNITEAAVISNGLALVRVENLKFVSDIGDIIKHNISQADPMDLIFLTKGAFYLRNFKHTRDVYAVVHAQAMTMLKLKKLQPAHV